MNWYYGPIETGNKMTEKLKMLWKTNKIFKLAAGIFAGAVLGYGYYFFIGCRTGTCAITGSPVNSTIYGAVMGLVLSFPAKKSENNS